MNLLTKNSKIYKQIRFLRPVIGALIRGNVKPLIGYFRYLHLENKLKEKDFGTLSFALYHYGFNIENQILSYLIQEKSIVIKFYDDSKFYVNHLLDYYMLVYIMNQKLLISLKNKLKITGYL